MINPQLEEQASLYVLDLLPGEERDRFEQEMRESAELRAFVRELRNGLFDKFRLAESPPRPDLLEGIHQRLGLPPSTARAKEASPKVVPWATIWAVAALLFLSLNLALLYILSDRTSVQAGELIARAEPAANPELNTAAGILPGNISEETLLQARIERLERELAQKNDTLRKQTEKMEALDEQNRDVIEDNSIWRREYGRLASRFVPFYQDNPGMSRFTVIEMVDAVAHEQQLPKRGFADLAGRFLIGGDNIAGVEEADFIGPTVEGAGIASATFDGARVGLTPVAEHPKDATALGDQLAGQGERNGEPAGFTVWRDDDQTGFLDLYSLPEAGKGRAPYLWVRSSERENYLPVGFLPELEGGTGSLFYSVDQPNFTPSEILITSELQNNPAPEPSGGVLMRGP